ncbi:small secreted protein [Mycena rebaudengoi]|nr:small secreted protein [Mycena rebaudengoi]
MVGFLLFNVWQTLGAFVWGGLNQGGDESLLISNVTGTVGDKVLALGNVSNALYIIIPGDDGKPNNGGLHSGAHAQWAPGGFSVSAGGLFISTDVRGTSTLGYQTIWAAGAIFIQAPFPDGVPINHTVISSHSCKESYLEK